jgi:F-type H+-transporting ATPase subunit b
MNFDWTTFFLEFVNFFILLWILRHFLYRPVLQVIHERQDRIATQIADAERIRQEADASLRTCEQRLSAWEQEKMRARAELKRELVEERERGLVRLRDEWSDVRAKHEAQEARERQEWARMTEQRAMDLGGRFASRLLERIAAPEVESRLLRMALDDLRALPRQDAEKLRDALAEESPEISTGFVLDSDAREELAEALGRIGGRMVVPVFREEPSLLAGLRLRVGPWLLAANLGDELKGFCDGFPDSQG